MTTILDIQENGINANGHDGEEHHLKRRERRPWSGARVVWQDETQHGERENHHEKGIGALKIVMLFLVAETAKHQRQP